MNKNKLMVDLKEFWLDRVKALTEDLLKTNKDSTEWIAKRAFLSGAEFNLRLLKERNDLKHWADFPFYKDRVQTLEGYFAK